MKITEFRAPPHWNYFLCLEEDLARLSRWIEFAEPNFGCYSLETARLLMTLVSEVDVVAKLVCKTIDGGSKADGIFDYQKIIMSEFPTVPQGIAAIPRYGLEFQPWSAWEHPDSSPEWWKANNKVKHRRAEHFDLASVNNVLDAAAALLILLTLLHRHALHQLVPPPQLFEPRAFVSKLFGPEISFSATA